MKKNIPHVALDVYDYNRKKLCNLYDSKTEAKGQAYNIVYTNQISGLKTVSFNIPFLLDEKRNFRWNFIKSEYLLRQTIDNEKDWFVVCAPKKTKSNRTISNSVICNHLSDILKTKNLYLTFDDENGIGTLQYLIEQVLRGTGWSLGMSDTFFERDGTTEKIRTLTSDGKVGAYQLISEVCNLFNGYPVFHGETKTVDIFSLNNKGKLFEMTMGRDIESLTVEFDSSNIITRLYVEGEYNDYGYVGIDDVNPTGLSYLMNFDYYKSIGMFTDDHQIALDKYYRDMAETIATIKDISAVVGNKENRLNDLWGQIDYVLYPISNMQIGEGIPGGTVSKDQFSIHQGDKVTVLNSSGTYTEVAAGENGSLSLSDTDTYAVKFITKPSGLIGAKEVSVDTKRKLIEDLNHKIANETSEDKIGDYRNKIGQYEAEIFDLYVGNSDTTGLYALMHEAVALCAEIIELNATRSRALFRQESIEAEFRVSMGDMLKEGYWNNSNYALGQEEFLYEDAVNVINRMSWPDVNYQVSRISQARQFGYKSTDVEVNMQARVYDPDLGINDIVYVSSVTMYLDNPKDDTVELSNDDLTITGVTFDSILSRMTHLADLIDQKNSLYKRAEAIGPNGSIYIDRLEGQINVLKNRLSSTVSSWYTDDNGNIIFEATTGKSAMMLTGDGFMIANGRLADGSWNWRTFGTGEGFTADAIITGYLSADRIEARSITVDKLNSAVGAEIDLSQNNSIIMMTEDMETVEGVVEKHKETIEMMRGEISTKVSSEQFREELDDKLDAEWVTNVYNSEMKQTAKDISFVFENAKQYTDQSVDGLNTFKEEVQSYQRFSSEGLELGKVGDPFKVNLSNEKLSFYDNEQEVAYISNRKMYITDAQVTNSLSIGNFIWVVMDGGIGLKWKG